jgi:iron complex outermembrane receptor protein
MLKKTVALPCSVGALIAVSSLVLAAPPAAQTAAPSSATSGSAGSADEETLEEIVVTAEKRRENLEVVPVAVSAYTSKERDLIGIETLQDLTDFTPGLSYSTVLDRAFIRGIGRNTNNLATQPGVATYNDGVYSSATVAASGDPLFVDHVEVLRGPQGTLYGRNSIGGTVNEISKHPTADWSGEARVNLANYGTYNFVAFVSGPISDNLRFRLSGFRDTQEDGYFNDLALPGHTEGGKGNSFYWEGQLEWDITSALQFWMRVGQTGYGSSYRSFNTIGSYSYVPFPVGNLSPSAGFGFLQPSYTALDAAQCNNNPGSINIHSFCTNTPSNAKLQRDYQVTPQLTWKTPYGFDIKYIGGYTTYFYDLHTDFDGTSMLSYTYPGTNTVIYPNVISHYVENKKYWSNELDFTSNNDSNFEWITGLYQYAEHEDQPFNIPEVGQFQLARPLGAAPNVLGDTIYATDLNIRAHSYAAFAQTDWKFVPTWKLTTGVRYNYDKESGPEATRLLYFSPGTLGPFAYDITRTTISFAPAPGVVGPPTLDPVTGNYVRQLEASWNAVTGTAGVEWTPNDSTLGYFKYSRGYKSGGLNAGAIVPVPETSPEYVNAYELGAKYSTRKFQINEAVYYYDYKGDQIPLSVQPPTGPVISETFNIPKVTEFGSESEIIFRPLADWMFLLSYSYMEAYIATHFKAVDDVAAFTVPGYTSTDVYGHTLPLAPRHKLALNTNYTWHFTPGLLNFSASYIYKVHTYSSIFNEPYNLAPSYSTVDFRTTWTDSANRYTVFAYCHNCANKIGYDGIGAGAVSNAPIAGGGPLSGNSIDQTPGLIPPRQFGIEFEYRWGK